VCRKTRNAIVAVVVLQFIAIGLPAAPAPSPDAEAPPSTFVFVPYEKSTGPKLGKDESVLLPYAEFLRLKDTAAATTDSPKFHPRASLSQSVYEGEIEGDVVKLEAELTIETLARPEDVLEVLLPFNGASVERASVEGASSWLAPLEKPSGLRLFLRGEGRRTVRVRLASQLASDGALKRMEFGVPRAAASSLFVRVGEEVVLPAKANTLPAVVERVAGGGCGIRASTGSADILRLVFQPRVVATGAAAKTRFGVSQDIVLSLSAQSAAARVTMNVDVLAGVASSVGVRLAPSARLLRVTGSFVKDWSAPDADGVVTVSLVRELSEPFALTLETQIESPAGAERLDAPEFRVPGAAVESGLIVVAPDAGLSFWPEEKAGLESAPAPKGQPAGARAFRFAQPGWRLALSRKPTPARVRAQGLILYEATDEFVRLKSLHGLSIDGRGIFQVLFDAPEGFELREAGPPDLVSGFRQQGRRIEVNFRGEQLGNCAVLLSFQRPRVRDGGRLELASLAVIGADEDAGSVVLAAPAALRVTELESEGLEPTDVRALQGELGPLLSADLAPALGYRYFTPAFRAVELIERQRKRITCDTALLASIEPSLMRIDATLNYNVEFSATDEFQLLVPTSAGEAVRFSGADIKEKTRATPAAGDDLTTWTIRLQRRVIGPYRISLSFDAPLPGSESSGKPLKASVPMVHAANVARETGFIAVSRGENLEVQVAESRGLEPKDVKELPSQLASAFLGFRYYDPRECALQLQLIRHELEKVLGAVIRRMHVETVLSDQREAVHEVFFEVQNNREQYLELRLPGVMEIWSAFVRGAPVRSSKREADGARLIELTKSELMDTAFRVRLICRETLPGGEFGMRGKLHFNPPEPLNMPVLRTTWKLYLPVDYRYVWFGGAMQHLPDRNVPWIEPAAENLINDLPAAIAGGIAKPTLHPPQAAVDPNYKGAESSQEKQARLESGALEIPMVRQGSQFQFSKLSAVGDIEVSYWKPKPLIILQGAFGLILFAVLIAVMASMKRQDAGWIALAVSFILASLTAGLTGRLCATALAASAAALALALCVLAVKKTIAARRDAAERPQETTEDNSQPGQKD
jgi:hypothetical protein